MAPGEYQKSRVDMADETAKNLRSHLKAILPVFGDRDPAAVAFTDVQRWISSLSTSSLPRRGVQIARGLPATTLAAQLDHSRKSLTLDTCSDVLTD